MAVVKITEAEVFEALALAAPGAAPEHARTVQELSDAAGVSIGMIRDHILKLSKAGRVKVHRVKRARIDGQVQPVPAYTFLPAKRK